MLFLLGLNVFQVVQPFLQFLIFKATGSDLLVKDIDFIFVLFLELGDSFGGLLLIVVEFGLGTVIA